MSASMPSGRRSRSWILNPDETRCLGCVYLRPVRPEAIVLCEDAACAAEVGFWVRMHERQNGLDQHLPAVLREWFEAEGMPLHR